MKKLLIILVLCLIPFPILAADQPQQDIQNNQTYGTINLQKQPEKDKQKQGISNHFTFFTVNVQINGKIQDNVDNNAR